ncbi:endonuclease/exonuclease/phosphatase family protein [Tropicimonas isoalkanivorans]|uniref:Endonuclease/Exonuclease/phosphatase family protein n=1 Tax=Tropicimonas isoalkanivorans TaxID=441112 RepID=A0A1I1JM73_9RHOB|nr:endonuclease/exonuclease/phosphatase family protein [Tropicimonas isoalkanivorans]SFC47013.1 Endonuclease/Exonuclease/phosphatase family protein [Tropicimonas isoalkanivorans]
MRIATYNVEWMNALFDDEGQPIADEEWSARYDITRATQLEAIGIVFTALDADAVLVIEAPDDNRRRSTVQALENFARVVGLRQRRAVIGFRNHTEQEIALLYDPDVLSAEHDPRGEFAGKTGGTDAPRFDGSFQIDLDIDATLDVVQFSKPPLELAMRTSDGFAFHMIGVHVKSKAPHGARRKDDIMRRSIANRRKQLAQCIWLRQRVDEHLAEGEPLIVLGDFNDGPGLDEYEALFGRSGVEIVSGHDRPTPEQLHDPNALPVLARHSAAHRSSARFYNDESKQYVSALLDFIMLSGDLLERKPTWRIWHPFDDTAIYKIPELRQALLDASDHFPVTLDIDLSASAIDGSSV